jgi:hypothetical protein
MQKEIPSFDSVAIMLADILAEGKITVEKVLENIRRLHQSTHAQAICIVAMSRRLLRKKRPEVSWRLLEQIPLQEKGDDEVRFRTAVTQHQLQQQNAAWETVSEPPQNPEYKARFSTVRMQIQNTLGDNEGALRTFEQCPPDFRDGSLHSHALESLIALGRAAEASRLVATHPQKGKSAFQKRLLSRKSEGQPAAPVRPVSYQDVLAMPPEQRRPGDLKSVWMPLSQLKGLNAIWTVIQAGHPAVQETLFLDAVQALIERGVLGAAWALLQRKPPDTWTPDSWIQALSIHERRNDVRKIIGLLPPCLQHRRLQESLMKWLSGEEDKKEAFRLLQQHLPPVTWTGNWRSIGIQECCMAGEIQSARNIMDTIQNVTFLHDTLQKCAARLNNDGRHAETLALVEGIPFLQMSPKLLGPVVVALCECDRDEEALVTLEAHVGTAADPFLVSQRTLLLREKTGGE